VFFSDGSGTLLFPLETEKESEWDKEEKEKESLLYVLLAII
jgi:hypothetical protein